MLSCLSDLQDLVNPHEVLKNAERYTVSDSTQRTFTLLLYSQGPKVGCGEGGCGACTVIVDRLDAGNGELKLLHQMALNSAVPTADDAQLLLLGCA